MPRKGPKQGEGKVTTMSFYPHQFNWLLEQRIKNGQGSMAEIVRELIDKAIEIEKTGGGNRDTAK